MGNSYKMKLGILVIWYQYQYVKDKELDVIILFECVWRKIIPTTQWTIALQIKGLSKTYVTHLHRETELTIKYLLITSHSDYGSGSRGYDGNREQWFNVILHALSTISQTEEVIGHFMQRPGDIF